LLCITAVTIWRWNIQTGAVLTWRVSDVRTKSTLHDKDLPS